MTVVLNKEAIRYDGVIQLETIICYKCAIPFAVPAQYKTHLRSSQESFYCPNGHSQCYTKSTETILKEKMEAEKQKHEQEMKCIQNTVEYLKHSRDRVIKERTVLKGKITKINNRIKNGVCPCCNRTFQNLQHHMKTQHPDFNKENELPVH